MRESKSKPESAEGAEAAEASTTRTLGLNQLTEFIIGAAIEVHRVDGVRLGSRRVFTAETQRRREF